MNAACERMFASGGGVCEAPGRAGDPCKRANHWRGTDKTRSGQRCEGHHLPCLFRDMRLLVIDRGGALSRVCVIVPKKNPEALTALVSMILPGFHTSILPGAFGLFLSMLGHVLAGRVWQFGREFRR